MSRAEPKELGTWSTHSLNVAWLPYTWSNHSLYVVWASYAWSTHVCCSLLLLLLLLLLLQPDCTEGLASLGAMFCSSGTQ